MKFIKAFFFTVILLLTFVTTSFVNPVWAQSSTIPVVTNDESFSDFIEEEASQSTKSLFDYGNWCGANNTSTRDTPSIDGVDEVCKAHDLCIGNGDHKCGCDATFLRNMLLASASSERGEAYKIASIPVIASKPCYCSSRLPNYPCCDWRGCKICQGGEIRWPGVGGQCGPKP